MLRLGIVGLPDVGRSTLFNALTSAKALVANYPFATIEPNTGIVQVPDPRLDALAAIVAPERVVPAAVEFVDIAGLVKGASQGEGLGDQFLANIREVDAILHVVRCFEDPDVQHVMGPVDPARDREVINIELGLADLASVEKRLDKSARATSRAIPQRSWSNSSSRRFRTAPASRGEKPPALWFAHAATRPQCTTGSDAAFGETVLYEADVSRVPTSSAATSSSSD